MMALGAILILVMVGSAIVALPLLTSPDNNTTTTPPANEEKSIALTLLDNAGVMIEANDLRIYIDPINLNSSFENLDADAVLVTHPHGDHYQGYTIHMLQKEDTMNVFPANMSDQIANHDGIGVVPGDSVQVGTINITAFYMYTFPVDIYPASHPREANWTSYIIDIDGFTIFHAGDSKNIDEYEQLAGQIDVALLPLGPGCQTMADFEIVLALETINPGCFIPIHYVVGADQTWIAEYDDMVADRTTDCDILSLAYFESHTFQI
jgi:L-ascorbate metabolism protein UlaG (beta-lactamase superfamily)